MFPLRHELRRLAGLGRPPRIAIVRPGALGDTVLLLPTVQRIREELPHAALTLVGSHWTSDLVPLLPVPWQFVSFESPELAGLFAERGCCAPPSALCDQDLVVIYTSEPDGAFVRNVRRSCAGLVIPWLVEPPPGVHAACHFAAAVAAALPREDELPIPSLRATSGGRRHAGRWLEAHGLSARGPLAVVHPGSGGRWKCWPALHFAELICRLAGRGWKAALLQGPADARACEAVSSLLAGPPTMPVAEFDSLEMVAGLIARADAFVGSDSGVTHLAAALGVSTVAAFGPTDPAVWGPLGRAARAIRGTPAAGSSWAWPHVADVLDAVLTAARVRPA
jgi:hypothetical protein